MTDYEDLQKRCQRGATNLNDANNLLAECYGMLGKLVADLDSANKHWANESNNVQALTAEVVRLKSENEALRKDAELYQQVQIAAGLLPHGWEIALRIENGYGGVDLIDPYGTAVDLDSVDESLSESIASAVAFAMSKEG